MKNILIAVLSIFIISCSSETTTEESNIIGSWSLTSKKLLTDNNIEFHPDSNLKIKLKFSQDSFEFWGCDRILGSEAYTIGGNNTLTINAFPYIEFCEFGDWIESTAHYLVQSMSYEIIDDTLNINTQDNNEYWILSFERE